MKQVETKKTKTRKPATKPYVIVRSDRAGVFAGELAEHSGTDVRLDACRRLWSWRAQSGVALSGVAIHGLDKGCKVDTETQGHYITGVLEIIPASPHAEASIRAYQ